MTLLELRTELEARGFEEVNDTLLNGFINRAYYDQCDRYPWPFLETTAAQYPPIVFTDLAHVLNVRDNNGLQTLTPVDYRSVLEADPGLAATGAAQVWYMDNDTLKVWPVHPTNTISVRYIKAPTALSADGDVPISPVRFHPMIVDGAAGHAHKRAGKYAESQECFGRFEHDLEQMAYALLSVNYDSPFDMVLTDESTDW